MTLRTFVPIAVSIGCFAAAVLVPFGELYQRWGLLVLGALAFALPFVLAQVHWGYVLPALAPIVWVALAQVVGYEVRPDNRVVNMALDRAALEQALRAGLWIGFGCAWAVGRAGARPWVLESAITVFAWVFFAFAFAPIPGVPISNTALTGVVLALFAPVVLWVNCRELGRDWVALTFCLGVGWYLALHPSTTAISCLVVGIGALVFVKSAGLAFLMGLMGLVFINYCVPQAWGMERFSDYALFWRFWTRNYSALVGSGPGSFSIIGPQVQIFAAGKVPDEVWVWAHSDWLQSFFEMGIVGFGATALGYLALLVRAYPGQWFAPLCVVGLASLAYFPFHHPAVGACFALVMAEAARREVEGWG